MFQLVMVVFEEAMKLPASERADFVAKRVPEDASVRQEVQTLLEHAESQDKGVGTGVGLRELQSTGLQSALGSSTLDGTPGASLPALRGAYRIIRTIGEGGMGVVYEAQQSYPRRRVALKALRGGHATASMIARFQREVQVLARLQHPGIAAIYEAGVADEASPGQAFFAMEYVDGHPLNVYITQQRSGVRSIVELMILVCDAVQHAHQRGVIHRDLKPANILVTNLGEPKVVDFGIARASEEVGDGSEEGAAAVRTHEGQLVGTPAYMSPEQLRGLEVDTRSDVYSLGVVTFEAICGKPPFAVSGKPLAAVITIVCNSPTPLLQVPDSRLASDLRTVVAKAMATDPARRYASAAEFSGDLRRVLSGEAVVARRDSVIYIMRKAIMRHRTAAVGLCITLIALLLFTVYAAVSAATQRSLALQATFAQEQAERSLKDATGAKERAQRAEVMASLATEEALDQLALNTIERGRAEGNVGNISLAEELLWKAYQGDRLQDHAHWALAELYCNSGSVSLTSVPRAVRVAAPSASRMLTMVMAKNILWTAGNSAEPGAEEAKTQAGTAGWQVQGPTGTIVAVASVPGQERAIVCTRAGEMYYVDLRVECGPAYWPLVRERLPENSANLIAVSADGQRVAVVGSERTLRVLELESGRVLGSTKLARNTDGLSISPQTGEVVVGPEGFNSGDVEFYAIKDGVLGLQRRMQNISESALRCFAFSRDGGWLLCGSRAGTLTVIDLRSSEPVAALPRKLGGVVYTMAQGPVGESFVVAAGDRAFIYDPRGSTIRVLARNLVENWWADWIDESRVRVMGTDGDVRIFNTSDRDWVKGYRGIESWCFSVSYSANGDRLYVGSGDSTIRAYNTSNGEGSVVYKLPGPPLRTRAILTLRDDRRVVAASEDGMVRVIDVRTGVVEEAFASGRSELFALALDKDEHLLAVGSSDGYVRVHDMHTCEVINTLERGNKRAEGLAFAPDGKTLAISGNLGGVKLYDVPARRPAGMLSTKAPPWAVRFSNAGDILYVTLRDGTLTAYDVATQALIYSVRAHQRLAPGLDISGDGKVVATGSEDGFVKLWSADTGKNLMSLAPGLSTVVQTRFSPDDSRLAVGAAFFEAREYDFRMVSEMMIKHAARYREQK
jgi:WD40 repeat protein